MTRTSLLRVTDILVSMGTFGGWGRGSNPTGQAHTHTQHSNLYRLNVLAHFLHVGFFMVLSTNAMSVRFIHRLASLMARFSFTLYVSTCYLLLNCLVILLTLFTGD